LFSGYPEKSLPIYTTLATDLGFPEAQNRMSFHMLNGLATQQSIPDALVYQTFASLGNSNFAKQALAFQHLAGLGVKKDCEKSLVYYQKVAQQVIEDYQSLGITTVANRYNSDITKNIVKLYEWTDPSEKNCGR